LLIRRLVYIAFFVEVGLLLVFVPWSGFWDTNYFGTAWPSLRPIVSNNFLRGAVTGLGVVNLFAAVADVVLILTGTSDASPNGKGDRRP
jgi:hypothetical protein